MNGHQVWHFYPGPISRISDVSYNVIVKLSLLGSFGLIRTLDWPKFGGLTTLATMNGDRCFDHASTTPADSLVKDSRTNVFAWTPFASKRINIMFVFMNHIGLSRHPSILLFLSIASCMTFAKYLPLVGLSSYRCRMWTRRLHREGPWDLLLHRYQHCGFGLPILNSVI